MVVTIPADVSVITAIIQTGALGALIWLVIDTRREAQRREDRLLTMLESYTVRMQAISESLVRLERWLSKTE